MTARSPEFYQVMLMRFHWKMSRIGVLHRLIQELENQPEPAEANWKRFKQAQLREYRDELMDLKRKV
jgi:hypothetical protein